MIDPSALDLGDLGEEKPLHRETFGWFGTRIRVHPSASEAVLVDFVDKAEDINLPDNPEDLKDDPESRRKMFAAFGEVKNFVRRMIHPEDFETFWTTGVEHGYGLMDFMGVSYKLLELVSGHPSPAPVDSSTTRRATQPKSAADSSQPGEDDSSNLPLSEVQRRVKAKFEQAGRPDFALMVLESAEHDTLQGQKAS